MTTDLTVGKPSQKLFWFSIPLLLSVAFQQLYQMADSIIVGRFAETVEAGELALAAVGASYPITQLFVAVATGINIGTGVLVSQLFGAKRYLRMKTAISTALLTTTTVALLLTLIGAIGTHGIMNALSTPENIFADGSLYLRVYVFGLLFLFIYNVCTGIFNAMGDSRTPLILLVLIALTVLSVRITGFDLAVLVKKGSKFFDILKAMFPPNTAYLGKIWQPLWDTIKMSILGSFIGAVLAVPFAVAAASNIVTNRVVVFLVRLFLSLVRTLPTLVCALIATYIFGLGTMAGTCAIAVFTFAYVGKQLFEIIETVDMGPYEAMEALGATRLRAFTTAVFPQVLPTYLSVSLFCLEGNVRYASILGYVGAGGLGLIMNEKIGWREYDSLGMILIVLFVTVMVIEGISHALRKRLT